MTPQSHDSILDLLPPPFEWCEIPAGQVTLEDNAGTFDVAPFKLEKYPVTYAQFQVFIDAKDGFKNPAWRDGLAAPADHWEAPGDQQWKIDNHPRESVSWYDAIAYCRWLTSRVGYEVRLPAEWEWQWAAQGPEGRTYPWGNDYIQGYANVNEVASQIKGGKCLKQTTPVDAYPQGASPFEAMDMSGNVWERQLNAYDTPGNTDLESDVRRAVRGGSWGYYTHVARAAFRYLDDPNGRNVDIGFRLARS